MEENTLTRLWRLKSADIRWGAALAKAMQSSKFLKTQTALARRSGVAQTTIGRILRDEVDPQSGNLCRLARALGMSLTTLTRIAEDVEMESGPVLVSEQVPTEEIDRALRQAHACREERKCGEQTLDSLRRRESDAVERDRKSVV